MDVSPMSSSAKSGSSDFSIERILSDESANKTEQCVEVPNWLCCTRYQPPRVPRSVNGCRARRSGRHARVPFTAAQASALEAAYARAPYLAPPALRALAAALHLRDDRIKIWFQNRRARERREKSTTLHPPREVTLPATAFSPQRLLQGLPWMSDTNDSNKVPQHLNLTATVNAPICGSSRQYLKEERSESPLDIETVDD